MRIHQAASVAVTTALVASLGVLGVGAASAASHAESVKYRDFPTTKAVSKISPALRGGTRHRSALGEPQRLTSGCLATQDVTPRTTSSRKMTYADRRGRDIYLAGKASPLVSVYLYPTKAQAAQALAQVRTSYRACRGEHTESSVRVKVSGIALPAIGQARLGFRRKTVVPDGTDRATVVMVQRGRYLVETDLVSKKSAPSRASTVKLARLAVRSLG